MTSDTCAPDKGGKAGKSPAAPGDARQKRLADALRANLARRKAQARARAAAENEVAAAAHDTKAGASKPEA